MSINVQDDWVICRSMQSFLDVCDNKLVVQKNVHCVFPVTHRDTLWMSDLLKSSDGVKMTFNPDMLITNI
ncbi:hypothetical protein BCU12_22665 [Vibrio sp. 10N.261.55.A7]|nr:hypothetical protein BCU12_22665 [Vibrio sp. 10N.261.55.A7]